MEIVALILGAVLAVVLVVFVARPFLREPSASDDRLVEPSRRERERLRLEEERDRALAALRELEFDHRTGKISSADYRQLEEPLRRRAATVLRALDRREASDLRFGGELAARADAGRVPDPWPPPDEGDLPEPAPPPAPGEPTPGPEEPSPPHHASIRSA
jgi:hypothetical protein